MAQSPIQPKKQDNKKNSESGGWGWQGSGGRGCRTKFETRGVCNIGVFHKIRVLAALCKLCNCKLSHPPHSWLSPISRREGGGGGGVGTIKNYIKKKFDIHHKHQTNWDKEIKQFLRIYVLVYFIVLYCYQHQERFLYFYHDLVKNVIRKYYK